MRASMALATVRALIGRDVTTLALPRSRSTSGTSVYHVPIHGFLHFLSSESKDTRGLCEDPSPSKEHGTFRKPLSRQVGLFENPPYRGEHFENPLYGVATFL
jgi:hypothetical protein